jgi:hypothetical protein
LGWKDEMPRNQVDAPSSALIQSSFLKRQMYFSVIARNTHSRSTGSLAFVGCEEWRKPPWLSARLGPLLASQVQHLGEHLAVVPELAARPQSIAISDSIHAPAWCQDLTGPQAPGCPDGRKRCGARGADGQLVFLGIDGSATVPRSAARNPALITLEDSGKAR